MTTLAFTAADALPTDTMAETVTAAHFGLNLVASSIPSGQQGFAGSALAHAIAGLSPGSIRYPGGTVTELLFDPANENATTQAGRPVIPQAEAIAFAARTGATLDLVLQTRSGFEQSAAEALVAGTYGQRLVSAAYLDMIHGYVVRSLQDAAAAGTRIATFEIGNEFFYSGEMTASEYAQLARAVLLVVQAAIDSTLPAEAPEPLLLVQTLNAAGRFSPRADTAAWVSGEEISFTAVPGWQQVTVPGQGSAAAQADRIADRITGAVGGGPDLSHLVDGLIGHDYNARGHRTDDANPVSYNFAQFDRQEARLGQAPGSLSRHVTEWNARAFVPGADGASNDPALTLNRGLPLAGLLVEMFYQFQTHGVDAAHIWPVYFSASNTTNLLDHADLGPRIPAAIFGLMQDSLIGLTPRFEHHEAGATHQLDSYGYGDDSRLVLFLSSRLAAATGPVTLDLGAAAGDAAAAALTGGRYFLVSTTLSAVDAAGRPSDGIRTGDARPHLMHGDGRMAQGDRIAIADLGGYGTIRIEVTYVGEGADRLRGRDGDDAMQGLGGNDTLTGAAGDDRLDGGFGDDLLGGDDGHDDLVGGPGADTLHGGAGQDLLSGGKQRDWLHGGAEDDRLLGGPGNDRIRGDGGNDRLEGGEGNDALNGGIGQDRLEGGQGNDLLTGGGQADVFVFADGFGRDRITDFRRSGADRIDLSGLTGADDVEALADLQSRLSVAGDDLVIAFAGGVIVIDGMAAFPLTAADFLF